MIGALGNVVFVVSAETVRTFDKFERSSEGRWAKHEIHLQKPKSEFLGPDLDVITFEIRFDVAYGINPRKEMDELIALARSGESVPLVIGGKGIGVNKWVIKSQVQKWTHIDNRGNVLISSVELTLEEYI